MVAAADRTLANLAVLPDSALNTSPVFPYHICNKNGYIVPSEQPVLGVSAMAVDLMPPRRWKEENGEGCNTVLGWLTNQKYLISPCGWLSFDDNTYTSGGSLERSLLLPEGKGPFFYEMGYRYRLVFWYTEDQYVHMQLYNAEGEIIGSDAGIYLNPWPTFNIAIGFPLDSMINCGYGSKYSGNPYPHDSGCFSSEGGIILGVSSVAIPT